MRRLGPPATGKLSRSTESWPALEPEWRMYKQRLTAGPAELSFIYFVPTDPRVAADLTSKGRGEPPHRVSPRFLWQCMTEPEFDHGFATTYEVLFDEALGDIGHRPLEALEGELEARVGASNWVELKAAALNASGIEDGGDNWRVLLTALWAEHLAEPLSLVWLAAMAQHAYYVIHDDFAFGYLTALLDQRLKNEEHFQRGAKAVESAALGGRSRAAEHRRKRSMILSEMARLVSKGHSVSRAGELAFEAGHGTSAQANRRLWVRHAKPA